MRNGKLLGMVAIGLNVVSIALSLMLYQRNKELIATKRSMQGLYVQGGRGAYTPGITTVTNGFTKECGICKRGYKYDVRVPKGDRQYFKDDKAWQHYENRKGKGLGDVEESMDVNYTVATPGKSFYLHGYEIEFYTDRLGRHRYRLRLDNNQEIIFDRLEDIYNFFKYPRLQTRP